MVVEKMGEKRKREEKENNGKDSSSLLTLLARCQGDFLEELCLGGFLKTFGHHFIRVKDV